MLNDDDLDLDNLLPLTPEAMRSLLNPSDVRWQEFEDPEHTREFVFDRYLEDDIDAFESVLDQLVACGYMQIRMDAKGDPEYHLTPQGMQWVRSETPAAKPALDRPLPPDA